MESSKLIQINLSNYRNFKKKTLNFSKNHTLITGKNAIGKTNILEAISFLSPGNGFRKDRLENLVSSFSNDDFTDIKINFNYEQLNQKISISIKKINLKLSKTYLLNDKKITQQYLLNIFQLFWFSEQEKIFFIKDKKYRRDICNRIMCYFNPSLFKLLNQYLKLRKEKKQIFKSSNDITWIKSLDQQLNILTEKIMLIKYNFMNLFNEYDTSNKNLFYKYNLSYDFQNISVSSFVNNFQEQMKLENESNGDYYPNSNFDPLKSVFSLNCNGVMLDQLSSAQSKMLILSFLLDVATFLKTRNNKITIFLIDEIFDNFDINNLQKVIKHCAKNNFQSFFTSTDNFTIKEQIKDLEVLLLNDR